MNRRLRIGLLSIGGLLAVVVVAALIATYVVLQPERFTALLQSRVRAAGLELTLDSPASPTLWPKPALELRGVTVRGTPDGTPLIVATHGKIVLPWHTLFGGDATISRLEVDGARIDLDALSSWIDTLPSRPSTAGAILPTIDAGFRITHGTLARGTTLVLADVDVDAGRLANGRAFDLSLAATADGHPYAIALRTHPELAQGVLTLGDLTLDVESDKRFASKLHGEAVWRGGADVGGSLAGTITREDASPFDVVLKVTPANQRDPLFVSVKVDGATDHADVRVPPLALAAWWSGLGRSGSPTLPPLLGGAEAAAVDVGNVHIKGLRIQTTPDAPAPPSSTAAPP